MGVGVAEPHRSRDEELADTVEKLENHITRERESQGLSGNAGERENTPKVGSPDEPPD
jgi:hypothetical protein